MAYEFHYTGYFYPSKEQIEKEAKERGFTHSFWASEFGYSWTYNGDTVVVYNSVDGMPDGVRKDALKYGKKIA